MSRLDEPTDRGSVLFSARMTVYSHTHGLRCCLECPGEGCAQDAWARKQLAAEPPPAVADSRCMGCAPRILPGPHNCAGTKTPPELGWRCVCPEPECQRRQSGDFSRRSHRR